MQVVRPPIGAGIGAHGGTAVGILPADAATHGAGAPGGEDSTDRPQADGYGSRPPDVSATTAYARPNTTAVTPSTPPIGTSFQIFDAYFQDAKYPSTSDVHAARSLYFNENWLFLAALAATSLGVPAATVALKIGGDPASSLFTSIKSFLNNPVVQRDLDFILERGLDTFYREDGTQASMAKRVADKVNQHLFDGLQIPNPILPAQNFVTAALNISGLIASDLVPALAGNDFPYVDPKTASVRRGPLTFGQEAEVADVGYDPEPLQNRVAIDPMLSDLARQLNRQGLKATLGPQNTDEGIYFNAKVMDYRDPASIPFTFRYTTFTTRDGRYFVAELMKGTGAILLTIKEINPATRELVSTRTKHIRFVRDTHYHFVVDPESGEKVGAESVFDCGNSMLWHVGNTLGFEDPLADMQTAIQNGDVSVQHAFLLHIKGSDGNIAKSQAEINLDQHVARLTLLNGEFLREFRDLEHIHIPIPPDTSVDPYRHAIDTVIDALKKQIGGRDFALKHDRIPYIEVGLPDGSIPPVRVRGVYEAHPYVEFITGILTPSQLPIWKAIIKAMQKLGWKGTADDRLIGRHTHLGFPTKTAEGRWTVGALQNLLLAAEKWSPDLRELFPSNEYRGGFNGQTSKEVLAILRSDRFDPEDRDHILLFAYFVARYNPQKYTAYGFDHALSKMFRFMIRDGTYTVGETRTVLWEGKTYTFRVIPDEAKGIQITGQEASQKQPTKLIRVVKGMDKYTFEVRFRDTDLGKQAEDHDDFFVRTMLAFLHRFAYRLGIFSPRTTSRHPSSGFTPNAID